MTAFNVMRFRGKAGFEEAFVEAHRNVGPAFKVAAARPEMVSVLDTFRHMLEDLGGGMGLTDPISGEGVLHLAPPKTAKKKPAKRAKAKHR